MNTSLFSPCSEFKKSSLCPQFLLFAIPYLYESDDGAFSDRPVFHGHTAPASAILRGTGTRHYFILLRKAKQGQRCNIF